MKEAAFDHLFRTNYKELCRFAVTFVSDRQVAEDLVQDVFFSVWQKRKAVDSSQSIVSYLYVSVRNACYSFLRRQRENVGIEALADEVVLPEKMPEQEDARSEELWKMVESLPHQCKVIFKLVVVEEMKYSEVASTLGVSVNTVKTQVKIAYKTLRGKIGGKKTFFTSPCFWFCAYSLKKNE